MLPVAIAIMVVSVAVGVIVLTSLAVSSRTARSAGRRTRAAMALSDGGEGALTVDRRRERATAYPSEAHRDPAAQQADTWGSGEHDGGAYPQEAEQVPRWALALGLLSGAGLLLGLLMVMIASIQ